MRVLLIILAVLLIGFLGMVAFLYVNQRKMLYFRQALDESLPHVLANRDFEYAFDRGTVSLRGWLLNPGNPKLIIYYGGNAEELSWNIDLYKHLSGYAILLMNYRGYGKSEGAPTEKDLVQDALALFDQLQTNYSSIVLIGRSLGSGIAVQVASQRRVEKVVLITPYNSILSLARGLYPWAPVSLFLKDPFDSMKVAGQVSARALFLVAEHDRVIPQKHSQSLADAWPVEHVWVEIKQTDHNSISASPDYWIALKSFLQER